ncbi:MAG TPA: helix-turn-helix transcriptional regulator [Woeseiaceae bacterium]|nr:helix-turn-helix transcriptional regulator [Woeseiaceae bacterium]
MGRTLKEKLDSLPRARRSRIKRRAAELVEQELSLRDLRKALHHTQVDIAKKMRVGQDTVSRYEQRTDMMLSTLERYVSAMGGTLTLMVEFPDREPVRVRTLGELSVEAAEVTSGMRSRRKPQPGKRAARRQDSQTVPE